VRLGACDDDGGEEELWLRRVDGATVSIGSDPSTIAQLTM